MSEKVVAPYGKLSVFFTPNLVSNKRKYPPCCLSTYLDDSIAPQG